jgi:hypothetical protein
MAGSPWTVKCTAVELYRRQIALGLDGDLRATQKARLALRNLLGTIQLEQGEGDGVWAVYEVHPAALIAGAGSEYRGEGI